MDNKKNVKLASQMVNPTYITQGINALSARHNLVTNLLSQRRMPENGWDDATIEYLLAQLAMMDSNNFTANVGVGEREARIYSNLVTRRMYHLGHGIGRSGDVTAVQPKAAGSSLIVQISQAMMLNLIKLSGILNTKKCLILPCATGMSLALTMLTLKSTIVKANPGLVDKKKYVIWNRIDQKACFKSIITAGFVPIVVENILIGDELTTNLEKIVETIETYGKDEILCVMSTTSCFAPRACDNVEEISKICKKFDVGHIINNAYGLQLSKCCHVINQACRVGRVDAYIQSTDKNLMVPVGGAIVAGPNKKMIDAIAQNYPGRASMSPILDVFITMLSMGSNTWKQLLKTRKELFIYSKDILETVAAKYGERILVTNGNTISIGISLGNVCKGTLDSTSNEISLDPTYLGSMLFTRGVSGTRVVDRKSSKTIGNTTFTCWGQSTNEYAQPYLTFACSIGMVKEDVDGFANRLDTCLNKFLLEKEKLIASKSKKKNGMETDGN